MKSLKVTYCAGSLLAAIRWAASFAVIHLWLGHQNRTDNAAYAKNGYTRNTQNINTAMITAAFLVLKGIPYVSYFSESIIIIINNSNILPLVLRFLRNLTCQ